MATRVYLSKIVDAEDKADGVQNVGLARPVESGDGIELGVPFGYDRAGGVRLEALQHQLFDVHFLECRDRRCRQNCKIGAKLQAKLQAKWTPPPLRTAQSTRHVGEHLYPHGLVGYGFHAHRGPEAVHEVC